MDPRTAMTSTVAVTVVLSQRVAQALREHRILQLQERLATDAALRDQYLVFPNVMCGPMDQCTVSTAFTSTLQRLSLPRVRFHDLRHTCATILLAQGVHPKLVSEMLGHSSIVTTTDAYSQRCAGHTWQRSQHDEPTLGRLNGGDVFGDEAWSSLLSLRKTSRRGCQSRRLDEHLRSDMDHLVSYGADLTNSRIEYAD